MKNTDRPIQEAIDIGHANKKIVELVQNWCAHVTIERFGGSGLVEEQTGLPIGMRSLNCPNAHDGGMAAMDLEAVAIDFYDRNCVGCAHRQPVRLPNLSEAVANRDERRARAQARAEQELDAERARVADRARRRRELAQNGDAGRRSILDRIDELDSEPTIERAALLRENLRAVPEKFDDAAQEALFALIDSGGLRARTALEILSVIAKDTERLADAALRMLTLRESPALAAQALGDRLRTASEDQIKNALPAIFELAAPIDSFGRTPPSISAPLLTAWFAAPRAVREFIRSLFSSDQKYARILACRSVIAILEVDPTVGPEFARLALQSIGRPDDSYGHEGSAATAVSTFLGASLRTQIDEVDMALQMEWATASEEQRSVIADAYLQVLKRRKDQPGADSEVEEKGFQRIVEVISTRRVDEAFSNATNFLQSGARHHLALVEHHAEILLGAAALLVEDLKERYSPLLDPRPSMLKSLEDRNRRAQIWAAVDALMELVGRAGAARPDTVGQIALSTFQSLHEGQDQLRAALVKCFSQIGKSQEGLAFVLHAIYSAMMAREQVVRAAAALAYGQIADEAAADLPQLMRETFLLLLRDPYVIVHKAAVHALRSTQLPKDMKGTARIIIWHLIEWHSQSHEEDAFLAECIGEFVSLSGDRIAVSVRSKLNAILLGMASYVAAPVLVTNEGALAGVPEYVDAVVRSLQAPDTFDSDRDDLLGCLERFSSTDIQRVVAEIEKIAANYHPGPLGPFERILDLVTRLAGWETGIQVAKVPLVKLLDVPRDRPLRRFVIARLVAVQIEAAIAKGNIADAVNLIKQWDEVHAEILAEHPDIFEKWPLLRAFQARLDVLSVLRRVSSGGAKGDDIADVVAEFDPAIANLGETVAGRAYTIYGRLVGAVLHLVKWAVAVRSAEQDADRFLRAAKQASKDVGTSLELQGAQTWKDSICKVIAAIGAVAELEAVPPIASVACAVSLPLPFLVEKAQSRAHKLRAKSEDAAAPCVVFVSFTVDGLPLSDPHVITPDELHDLDVFVRVSRWPIGARLVLDALTVEPLPSIGELPKFILNRPDSTSPHETHQSGRMLIRVAQPIAARPLEFVYRAYFLPQQPSLEVVVEGERRIRVRSYDPERNPVTGYRQVDLRLLEIRDQLRAFTGVYDDEIDAFLLILAGLGQMAGEAIQDKTFPGQPSEKQFQQQVRGKLRGIARIGSELQEHANVAGGITDLSFREISIELKVEPDATVVPDNVESYSQQAAQYTTGNDKRLSVLCVLDSSVKTVALGSVANDIVLRVVPPPAQPGGVPLLLGVVIVRGNLPRPSDLSK